MRVHVKWGWKYLFQLLSSKICYWNLHLWYIYESVKFIFQLAVVRTSFLITNHVVWQNVDGQSSQNALCCLGSHSFLSRLFTTGCSGISKVAHFIFFVIYSLLVLSIEMHYDFGEIYIWFWASKILFNPFPFASRILVHFTFCYK